MPLYVRMVSSADYPIEGMLEVITIGGESSDIPVALVWNRVMHFHARIEKEYDRRPVIPTMNFEVSLRRDELDLIRKLHVEDELQLPGKYDPLIIINWLTTLEVQFSIHRSDPGDLTVRRFIPLMLPMMCYSRRLPMILSKQP